MQPAESETLLHTQPVLLSNSLDLGAVNAMQANVTSIHDDINVQSPTNMGH